MRKKLLYTFLIILIMANVSLLFMIINKPDKKDRPQKENFLTQELNFTEEQKERFLFLDELHRHQMKQFDGELKDLRKDLFNSFDKENFSPDSIALKMGELETAKHKELFTFFKQVRKICTPDQVSKFDEIIEKALRKRGPQQPKGKRRGPPRKDF
ncbi:MAG: hypothetical protein JKY02_09555 [Flavobacteriaceae bacterium]|nr:hypothetical protein [Flavobacteriaceae bacterium]